MWFADRLALELLAPLAVWVFASGLDDLVIDLSWLWLLIQSRLRPKFVPPPPLQNAGPEPRIAIVVPCWQEYEVIERMVESSLQSIAYRNYDIWLALYPNDERSIAAAHRAGARSDQVRWVVGERPGPTTKADNLNQALNGVLCEEQRGSPHYDIFLFHDAEDVIHPLELSEISELLKQHHMVQFPVLPLGAPLRQLTHGVYGDEFAEFHCKDLRVRAALGGFIPSAGVATALRREVIERLRILRGNETFNPRSLTEDYFLGLEVQRLGLRQLFSYSRAPSGELIASRSYFPHSFRTAVRQRARWIAGNNLQAWERFGWSVAPRQLYWLWRDRKGLLNQIPNLLMAGLFGFFLVRWAWAAMSRNPWQLGEAIAEQPPLWGLLAANSALLVWRLTMRAGFGWSVYGWRHASLAPLRMLWGNVINFCASWRAVAAFFTAKLKQRPLVWDKTAHSFPNILEAPKEHATGD